MKTQNKKDEKAMCIPFESVIIVFGVVKRATTFDLVPLTPFCTAHITTEELLA